MGDVQVANRIFSRRIYMKMLFSSQRREILNLFLTTKSVQCSSSHEKFKFGLGLRDINEKDKKF